MSIMHLVWLNQDGFAHNQYFQFSSVHFSTVLNIINDILHTFRGKKVDKEPEGQFDMNSSKMGLHDDFPQFAAADKYQFNLPPTKKN